MRNRYKAMVQQDGKMAPRLLPGGSGSQRTGKEGLENQAAAIELVLGRRLDQGMEKTPGRGRSRPPSWCNEAPRFAPTCHNRRHSWYRGAQFPSKSRESMHPE